MAFNPEPALASSLVAHRRHAGSAVSARERARRTLVALVMLVYLLVIFEGVLRKWALPGFGRALFFVRDPFVLAIYILASVRNLWPRPNIILHAWAVLAALGVLVMFLQFAQGASDPLQLLFAGYGWRNYFLYTPLALLIGKNFQRQDVLRVFRWTLWIVIPSAALAYIQFVAPIDAPINIGTGTDLDEQFHGLGFAGGHTRPMGTFTSVLGQTMLIGSAFAMLMGSFALSRRHRPVGIAVMTVAAVALMGCLAVGGSRAAVLLVVVTSLAALLVPILQRGRGRPWRVAALPLVLALVAVTAFPVVFPEAFDATVERWQAAASTESSEYAGGSVGRIFFNFFDFVRLMGDTPLFGYGLGLGGNASTTLGATVNGAIPREVAETEWSRQIVDLGPIFGLLFIIYRIGFTAWLGNLSLRALGRRANPLALLLFSFTGPELLYGLMTGHGTVNGYTWVFVGFTIAAAQLDFRVGSQRSAPVVGKSGRAIEARTADPIGHRSG